jgi:hypothetical protein
MKPSLFLLVSAFLFVSCSDHNWTNAMVNNTYSLQIPAYLETGVFYPEASLQYKNEEREIYLVVIDESKAQFKEYGLDYDLRTYFNVTARKIDSVSQPKVETMIIHTDSALTATLTGTVNNTPVSYQILCLESKTRFYKLVIWMRAQDREKYSADVDKIIRSFKELSGESSPPDKK